MSVARFSGLAVVCLCAVALGESGVSSEKSLPLEERMDIAGGVQRGHVHGAWCVHRAPGDAQAMLERDRESERAGASVNEVEPNDAPGTGQLLSLGTGGGDDPWINVHGEVSIAGDEDEYRFILNHGDIFGVAVNWDGAETLDPIVSLHDGAGVLLHENDDGWGYFSLPHDVFPLPLIQHDTLESMLQFVAPAGGEYRVRVRSWNDSTTGPYVATFGVVRHDLEQEEPAAEQIIFVDFDGETIDAEAIFGFGNNPAVLSPMRSFLSDWGLPTAFESVVIDEVMAVIDARFKEMSVHNPNFGYELLNSRDHADPFGQENVSRLIVGGTINESGISTIGIAEWIDPGNFSRDDTAIILLDILSSAGSGVAIQDIPRAPGFSLPQAIGRVVGNVSAHEAGHYLGCWHTENDNQTPSIMDRGGGNSFVISIPGLGPDGIIGSADDNPTEFAIDIFESGEGIGLGVEFTDQRVATALSTLATLALHADANGDGGVDVNDISYVLFRLGGSGTPGAVDGDTNLDGTVDVNDVAYVLFRLGG